MACGGSGHCISLFIRRSTLTVNQSINDVRRMSYPRAHWCSCAVLKKKIGFPHAYYTLKCAKSAIKCMQVMRAGDLISALHRTLFMNLNLDQCQLRATMSKLCRLHYILDKNSSPSEMVRKKCKIATIQKLYSLQ